MGLFKDIGRGFKKATGSIGDAFKGAPSSIGDGFKKMAGGGGKVGGVLGYTPLGMAHNLASGVMGNNYAQQGLMAGMGPFGGMAGGLLNQAGFGGVLGMGGQQPQQPPPMGYGNWGSGGGGQGMANPYGGYAPSSYGPPSMEGGRWQQTQMSPQFFGSPNPYMQQGPNPYMQQGGMGGFGGVLGGGGSPFNPFHSGRNQQNAMRQGLNYAQPQRGGGWPGQMPGMMGGYGGG